MSISLLLYNSEAETVTRFGLTSLCQKYICLKEIVLEDGNVSHQSELKVYFLFRNTIELVVLSFKAKFKHVYLNTSDIWY